MSVTVGSRVEPHNIALRVDTICNGRHCTWNINGHEVAFAEHKAVHVAVLAVIEPNAVTPGVYAIDPSVSGVRKVDGAELAVTQQKTMQGSQCTREINQSELALPKQVSVPAEKLADETHSDDIACIANAKASRVHIARREIDRSKRTVAQA